MRKVNEANTKGCNKLPKYGNADIGIQLFAGFAEFVDSFSGLNVFLDTINI